MVDNPNLWFQESICMMASIWALKEMYRTWETNAPYKQWAFYRNFLLSYANNAMKRQGVQYAGTSAQWLTQWENFLRSDYKNSFTHHLRVSQLSYSFLPIFEEHPEAWNAVRQMPSSKGKIKEYMRAWYDGVDAEDKGFVQAIAEEMGINVLSDAPNADAPDMNSDFVSLSFTHRSANALTPTNDRDEWSGWTKEIWEKTPDFTITPRPKGYLDFAESDIWSHWMYAHAPSVVGYDISGATYTSFGAYFGLPNPGCHAGASMEFLAYADGRKIYSSELYYEDYGVYISFDIPSGSKSLKIKIGFLESDQCDHYVLGEPKLFTPIESKETDTDAADTTIIDADVNNDGSVDLSDVLIVRRGMTKKSTYDTDVNNDGTTNILDLLIVKAKAVEAIITASPQKRKANITTWGALKVR